MTEEINLVYVSKNGQEYDCSEYYGFDKPRRALGKMWKPLPDDGYPYTLKHIIANEKKQD